MLYSASDQNFSFLGMSGSRIFVVEEEQKEIKSIPLSHPTSKNSEGSREFASECYLELQDCEEKKKEDDDEIGLDGQKQADQKYEISSTSGSCSAGSSKEDSHEFHHFDENKEQFGESEVADDDDGFRTPTSSDHKIPVIPECPPAPRKPRAYTSTKRKLSPRTGRSNLQLDLSKEIDLMFPPVVEDDTCSKNIKKSKRDVDDEE